MRNNKILAAAIASALSLGAGSAFATLQLRNPVPAVGTSGSIPTTAAPSFYNATTLSQEAVVFGSELFANSANDLVMPISSSSYFAGKAFVVAFKLGIPDTPAYAIKAGSGGGINVKATLSQGNWSDGGIITASQVIVCTTVSLSGNACPINATGPDTSDAITGLQILKGNLPSGEKDSVADFNIYPGTLGSEDITSTAHLFFSFAVDDLSALKDGGSLSITMESSGYYGGPGTPQTLASAETLEIAKILPGVLVDIQAESTPKVAIDVEQGLKGFLEGTSTKKDVACLGTMKLAAESTPKRWQNDASADFNPVSTSSVGTLQVTAAPFAASGSLVFLSGDGNFKADDGDGVWEKGESIIADSIDSTSAKWNLIIPTTGDSKLEELVKESPMYICLKANGTAEINEQAVAPTATFTYKYDSGSTEKTYSPRRLRHIKNNGSNCTFYNVPDGTGTASLDKVRIKIHNRSATKIGTLRGTLYDEKGNVLFSNQNLLPAEDTLGPGKTINLNTGEGDEFDIAKLATSGWTGQRAVLKLTSNLQEEEFEAFAYVRSASGQSVGNLSTGATGSGCK